MRHTTLASIRSWLDAGRFQNLIALEAERLQACLRRVPGYRILQIGRWGVPGDVLESCPMLCRWVADSQPDTPADIRFDGHTLPLASGSLDAVVMPHSLELTPDPHRLLREVNRVLSDRGQVVLLGFNPFGPWALGQRLRRRGSGYPAIGRLVALGRVRDWLQLLDFEITEMRRFGPGFPYLPRSGIALPPTAAYWLVSALAPAYLVTARKRVIPLRPISNRWRVRRPALAGRGMPEPTARAGNSHRDAA
ncbi:class I SAM-dependent methyltransferase [Spectribacter hydrogenooxidans]|uniref:Methyltransferase domain-containing protein n=1 Tax=Spectribacter hydrogenoxidans TaxID=3075608 RepID=A0ABU3C0R3_9GAMM|nr:methyltransferase domain-containing protein [Salinisphaera sp. W335]MDT0635142.1 methyltransferase domain-containing protein [Salinisphaera sp. W335]